MTDPPLIHVDRDVRSALLAVSDPSELQRTARWCIDRVGEPIVAVPPETGLVMLQVREPVCDERFHLGEVVVSRAEVEWDGGVIGWAMRLGTDREAAQAAAVCDGAAELDPAALAEVDDLCRRTAARRRADATIEWSKLTATRVSFEELD